MTCNDCLRCVCFNFETFEVLFNTAQLHFSVHVSEFVLQRTLEKGLSVGTLSQKVAVKLDFIEFLRLAMGVSIDSPRHTEQFFVVDADGLIVHSIVNRALLPEHEVLSVASDSFLVYIDVPFVFENVPLGQLKRLPQSVAARSESSGLLAVRFTPSGKIQYLFDTSQMLANLTQRKKHETNVGG